MTGPEASLATLSDAALESILAFLASNDPEPPWASDWWQNRLAAVRREMRRRIEEDQEGER
jgi:hypothetical protein